MLVGYGIVTNGQYQDIILSLNEAGCSKIFTDSTKSRSNPDSNFHEAVKFLQRDDILVITNISQLGKSVESIIKNLAILSEKETCLQILENNFLFSFNNKSDNNLLSIMIDFLNKNNNFKTIARKQTQKKKGSKTGRKTALNARTKKYIERLINSGYKVKEICKLASISESTFYKYFSKSKQKLA